MVYDIDMANTELNLDAECISDLFNQVVKKADEMTTPPHLKSSVHETQPVHLDIGAIRRELHSGENIEEHKDHDTVHEMNEIDDSLIIRAKQLKTENNNLKDQISILQRDLEAARKDGEKNSELNESLHCLREDNQRLLQECQSIDAEKDRIYQQNQQYLALIQELKKEKGALEEQIEQNLKVIKQRDAELEDALRPDKDDKIRELECAVETMKQIQMKQEKEIETLEDEKKESRTYFRKMKAMQARDTEYITVLKKTVSRLNQQRDELSSILSNV